jgi:dipeptidyl-peptidase-4
VLIADGLDGPVTKVAADDKMDVFRPVARRSICVFTPGFFSGSPMTMRVRKALSAVAELGTRLLPVSTAQPKEMLPPVCRPIISQGVSPSSRQFWGIFSRFAWTIFRRNLRAPRSFWSQQSHTIIPLCLAAFPGALPKVKMAPFPGGIMSFSRVVRAAVMPSLLQILFLIPLSNVSGWQANAGVATPGELTVERIFGQSSLSGCLNSGAAWAPDNHQLSFFETRSTGKKAKPELRVLDTLTAERSLLVPAEKLENVLGAGRRTPSQYHWAPGGDSLLFVGPHDLAWFDLKSQTARVLVTGNEDLDDAKISPDGKYVSFLREHNLWLVSTANGIERALTTGGTEEVRKGELDWVYPKELKILTGYWWAPDSSAIAFLEMDERKVTQFPLVDFKSFTGEAKMQRYPVPGGTNPIVRVLVVRLPGGQPLAMDIGNETDIYISRVSWLPDSRRLAIQRLNRPQTTLDLLIANATTGRSSVLLSEKDLYWINVSDDLHFLEDGKRFLWSSERTGYRHLFLYDLTGRQIAQITKGDWEVSQVEAVDEGKGVVYFTAAEKSPLERHLYRVGLDSGGFTRITREDGTHRVDFSPNATIFLDTYSNTSTPPRQDVYRADGAKLATMNENKVTELAAYRLSPVEFFTIRSHDDVLLNCSMIKPPNFAPTKKYPVLVFTYGGPHAQVVVNAWKGSTYLWHQLMAQKGYIIFSLDNRGSGGRGHLFEEPIHYRFGAQELADQRDGAQWLKMRSFVDAERIGIWGWGYGGHMTVHAMFEMPQLFKVGFAGGPVTDWHFYDAIYTERYIGILPLHEESYQESSPIENAAKLKGKLLIAHGSADDEVHYSNTLMLIDDLIKAGKYVEVIDLPGRGRPVRDPPSERVLWNRVTQFFLDNL